MYELIESFSTYKLQLATETLFIAIEKRCLNFVNYFVNKKINDKYLPINFDKASNGYIGYADLPGEKQLAELYQYTSFYNSIAYEENPRHYDSKKIRFFSSSLLRKIIKNQDEASLSLYINEIPEEKIVNHALIVLDKFHKDKTPDLVKKMSWFFMRTPGIDFETNNEMKIQINKSQELQDFYNKVKLNYELNKNLIDKEQISPGKKLKI